MIIVILFGYKNSVRITATEDHAESGKLAGNG
jgi:hypothetical protein